MSSSTSSTSVAARGAAVAALRDGPVRLATALGRLVIAASITRPERPRARHRPGSC